MWWSELLIFLCYVDIVFPDTFVALDIFCSVKCVYGQCFFIHAFRHFFAILLLDHHWNSVLDILFILFICLAYKGDNYDNPMYYTMLTSTLRRTSSASR